MNLTVISPCHNEEACLSIFISRIKPVLEQLPVLSWQIVFINDGSTDQSAAIINELRQQDQRIKMITFSRNFGYQAALLAGLESVESDLYAIIDVDCEDPPELLADFMAKIKEGNALVYGIRSQRKEPPLLIWCRKMFYQLNKLLADSKVYMWMAEFSMFNKTIRDAVIKPNTTFPFLRTEMAYVGYATVGVPYQRQNRAAGKSHYNILNMVKFALGGILASTTFPLRAILYLAILLLLLFLIVAGCIRNLFEIAMIAVILNFIFMLIAMPILGIYLARTYRNIVSRPNYFINREKTFL